MPGSRINWPQIDRPLSGPLASGPGLACRPPLRHGHFTGMMWALGVAILGSLTIAFGTAWAMLGMGRLWAPQTPMDWMTITLFLLAVETNVAVLAASAATSEPLDDDEV